jgi:DNA polymerase Ligase (LigD)
MTTNNHPTLRFVVQQHFREPEYWHYDLMLECQDGLITFSSGVPPDEDGHLPCLVRQLPNHRLAYLEHEGEISDSLGRCVIHDRGTFEWVEPKNIGTPTAIPGEIFGDFHDEFVVRLAGEKMRGTYRLVRETKTGTDHWRLRKEST